MATLSIKEGVGTCPLLLMTGIPAEQFGNVYQKENAHLSPGKSHFGTLKKVNRKWAESRVYKYFY